MRFHGVKKLFSAGAFGLALLASPVALLAQAPAGPLPAETPRPSETSSAPVNAQPQPQVQPRGSILGGWKLNRDESDDPQKKMQDASQSSRSGSPGGIRMGIPGIGGGPYGGHRGQSGQNQQDNQRIQALIAPPMSMNLAQKEPNGPEVDMVDNQNDQIVFFTDGRKLEKSNDPSKQEIAAHWDGNRLVTDEKNPRGGKLTRTYELSYDRTQLYETVSFNMGRSPVSIRYVFDETAGQGQAQARQ
jgi:hypothetical protein